jgi:HupE / UreJ protein
MRFKKQKLLNISCLLFFPAITTNLCAHGVDASTKSFLTANQGVAIAPFLYIGAKHMVTGYDHLLFLVGVIFFLFRIRDVLLSPSG